MKIAQDHLFTSKRLKFCYWDKSMLKFALELWTNPEVNRFISVEGFTQEQIDAKLEKEIYNQAHYKVQYWPLFTLNANEFIGCCGLRPKDIDNKVYELGIHLLPKFWGQGYAQEAMMAVINYAKQKNIIKLFAGHHPSNVLSQKMLVKLGFVAIHAEFYPDTGLYHPSYELHLVTTTI